MSSSLIKPAITWPVRSSSVVIGKLWLPAWGWAALVWVVLLAAFIADWLVHGVPYRLDGNLARAMSAGLPAALAFERFDESLLFSLAGTLFVVLAILLVAHVRYGRRGETAIFADRIELVQGNDARQTIRWNGILRQGKLPSDIWLEKQGSGKSSFEVIRFDVLEDGKRMPVRLFLHLNPLGRIAPTYRNVATLRRAFLLSLVAARPSLRVDNDVYALCEVHPVTMARSRGRKWFFRGLMTVVMIGVLAAIVGSAAGWSGWYATGVGIATVLSVVVMGTWLDSLLFISSEDERAVTSRKRLFGVDRAPLRMADDYPAAEMPADPAELSPVRQGEEWVDALIRRSRSEADCPWHILQGWQWSRLLGARPDLAQYCQSETLEGEDWAFLLADQPAFAPRCPWRALEVGDWATLLASQPQFLSVGKAHFQWAELDGIDWSDLLAAQPQFASHCDFAKLDGGDWAMLLREQPRFADQCPWRLLSDDDWTVLLAVQPQFGDFRREEAA